jgi:O-antigen/teichoic acid export membrane protein
VPPFLFLAAFADTVVLAWIGRPDAFAATVLLLLAGGYLVNSLTNAMAAVCQGIGRPDIQARQSALQLGANVVLSVGLFLLLGPLGAPLGTSLAFLAGAAYFGWRFHPVLETTTGALLREVAPVPLIGSLAATGAALAATWGRQASGRPDALLELALAGTVFAAVYLLVARLSGVLGWQELRQVTAALRRRPRLEEG